MTGPVATGDLWTVTLTSQGVPVTVSSTVTSGLVGLVVGLANAINALPGYKAQAIGTTLTISSEGTIAGQAFVLTSSSPSGSITEQAATSRRELVVFGPAVVGDKWTVTLTAPGGLSIVVTVPVTTDLPTLATDLGNAINLQTGYATLVSGNVITVNTAGPNFGKGFSVSYAIVRDSADTPSTSAVASTIGTGQGTPVAGETWHVKVGTTTYDHLVLAGETLAQVMADLAKQIVLNTSTDAAARAGTIVVLGTATFPTLTRFNGAAGVATTVDSGKVAIGGTPGAGETVTVNLGTSTQSVVVRETVPLAEIAAGLAALVNAAGLGFVASVDGDTLVIVDSNASGAAISFSIASAGTTAGLATVTTQAGTTRIALGGSSRIGEDWKLTIGALAPYIYTVESASVIAGRLAAAINGAGLAGIAATAEDATLVVVRTSGTFAGAGAAVTARNAFTQQGATVATIAPSAAVVEGETWKVAIGSALYTYVVQRVNGVLDTTAGIMAALAGKISAGVATGYTAFTDGSVLVITRADNAVFATPTFSVDPISSIAVDAATPTSRAVSFGAQGTPIVGQTWYVLISTADGVVAFGHAIVLGDTIASINTALAQAINANTAAGFRAVARNGATGPFQLYIADSAGRAFTASFEIGLADGTRGGSALLLAPAPVATVALSGTPAAGETWNIALDFDGRAGRRDARIRAAGRLGPDARADRWRARRGHQRGPGRRLHRDRQRRKRDRRPPQRRGVQRAGFVTPKQRPAGAVQVVREENGAEPVSAIEVQFAGTPVTGATWILQLVVGGTSYTFELPVTTGQLMDSVAAGFAALLNTAAQAVGSPLAGINGTVTTDHTLLISDFARRDLAASVALKPVAQAAIDGGSATTTLVDLIGTPQSGDVWRLRVGDLAFSVTIDATVHTLALIAANLAAQLNGSANPAAARYTAIADGERIVLIDRQGGVFDTHLDAGNITRSEGHADIRLDVSLTAPRCRTSCARSTASTTSRFPRCATPATSPTRSASCATRRASTSSRSSGPRPRRPRACCRARIPPSTCRPARCATARPSTRASTACRRSPSIRTSPAARSR